MADSVVCRNRRGRFSRPVNPVGQPESKNTDNNIEIDHNYGVGHVCTTGATGCEVCCPGIDKLLGSTKVNTSTSWHSGRRLIEWGTLLDNLQYCSKCLLGPLILSHQTIKAEMKCGLGGYLYVQCTSCKELNRVAYGTTHKDKPNSKGMPSFSVNTKLGAAMIDALGGPQRVNNVLSTLNLPPISHKNLKVMERRAGEMIEGFANLSMEQRGREAFVAEMSKTAEDENATDNTLEDVSDTSPTNTDMTDINSNSRNGSVPAVNSFGMTVCADHGWQKRGFDSLTGHTFLMSKREYGNKVLKTVVKHRTCATCKWWKRNRPGRKPRPHRCVWNHRGSARLMESQAGMQAIKEMIEQGTPVKTIEGDGDNTLVARLKTELGLTVKKKFDKNHTVKNIVSRLYNLQKTNKDLKLSGLVVRHLTKSLKYVFAKNQGRPDDMKENLAALIPHQFGDHNLCQPRFCGYKRKPGVKYLHRSLPYKAPLADTVLQEKLQNLFEPVIAKAALYSDLGSSQACEHANRATSLRAPKHLHYGESESLDFRVKASAACINEGRNYLSETFKRHGLSPGRYTVPYNLKKDIEREKRQQKSKLPVQKLRRLKLKEERSTSKGACEASEGASYESGYSEVSEHVVCTIKGKTVVLPCEVCPRGIHKHWEGPTWYAEGYEINPYIPNSDEFSIVGDLNSGEYNLQIENVTSGEEGEYKCFEVTEMRAIEQTIFKVKLEDLDSRTNIIVVGSSTDGMVYGMENRPLELICTVSSVCHNETITWYQMSQKVKTGGPGTLKFKIVPSRTHHHKMYVCEVNSHSLEKPLMKEVTLNIQFKPYVTFGISRQITVQEGKPLLCQCSSDSNPNATRIEVTKGARLLYDRQASTIQLKFNQIGRKDTGWYTCEAENILGKGESHIKINVLYKPDVPKQVRLIPGENYIVVTWKRNVNGGTDQLFVVEYKTNEDIRWLQEGPINDTLNPSLSHKLDGLETDRYYMIRVFAVNSFGNGNKTDVLIVKTLAYERKMDTLIFVPIGAAVVLLLVLSNVCNWYMQKRTRTQMQPVNNSSTDHPEENNVIQYGPYDEIDFQTDSDSSLHHSENPPIQYGPYDEIDLQAATYLEVVNSNSTISLKCLPESEGIIPLEASSASLSINSVTSSESSHECAVSRQDSTGYLNPYNVLHHDSQTIQQNTYKSISRLDNLTQDHSAGNFGIQNGPSDEIEFQTGTYLDVVNSSLTTAIKCLAESERINYHDVWEHSPTNSESSHECVIYRNDKDSYLNPCYVLHDDTENKHYATYTTMKRSSSTLLKEVDR